jgi:hypothetical protein
MEKEDGRKLAAEAQFERRKQAVRLHKQGKTPEQIAEMLGINRLIRRIQIQANRPSEHISDGLFICITPV